MPSDIKMDRLIYKCPLCTKQDTRVSQHLNRKHNGLSEEERKKIKKQMLENVQGRRKVVPTTEQAKRDKAIKEDVELEKSINRILLDVAEVTKFKNLLTKFDDYMKRRVHYTQGRGRLRPDVTKFFV